MHQMISLFNKWSWNCRWKESAVDLKHFQHEKNSKEKSMRPPEDHFKFPMVEEIFRPLKMVRRLRNLVRFLLDIRRRDWNLSSYFINQSEQYWWIFGSFIHPERRIFPIPASDSSNLLDEKTEMGRRISDEFLELTKRTSWKSSTVVCSSKTLWNLMMYWWYFVFWKRHIPIHSTIE